MSTNKKGEKDSIFKSFGVVDSMYDGLTGPNKVSSTEMKREFFFTESRVWHNSVILEILRYDRVRFHNLESAIIILIFIL